MCKQQITLGTRLTRQSQGEPMPPLTSEMIASRFLRKQDLDDDTGATIKKVSLEDVPGDPAGQRWVLFFRELDKGLVLNTTNIRTLEKAFGADSDDWRGRRVTLYIDPEITFRGEVVGGLRIRVAQESEATHQKRKGGFGSSRRFSHGN
jgi:hypothetical protein